MSIVRKERSCISMLTGETFISVLPAREGCLIMAPDQKYIYSYQPERRPWIDRILEIGKTDLVFYVLLFIIGTSLAAVSLAWVIYQVQAIWNL